MRRESGGECRHSRYFVTWATSSAWHSANYRRSRSLDRCAIRRSRRSSLVQCPGRTAPRAPGDVDDKAGRVGARQGDTHRAAGAVRFTRIAAGVAGPSAVREHDARSVGTTHLQALQSSPDAVQRLRRSRVLVRRRHGNAFRGGEGCACQLLVCEAGGVS